jgi:hypothetical protein
VVASNGTTLAPSFVKISQMDMKLEGGQAGKTLNMNTVVNSSVNVELTPILHLLSFDKQLLTH